MSLTLWLRVFFLAVIMKRGIRIKEEDTGETAYEKVKKVIREQCTLQIEDLLKRERIVGRRYTPTNSRVIAHWASLYASTKWLLIIFLIVLTCPFLTYFVYLNCDAIYAIIAASVLLPTALALSVPLCLYPCRTRNKFLTIKYCEKDEQTSLSALLPSEDELQYSIDQVMQKCIQMEVSCICERYLIVKEREVEVDLLNDCEIVQDRDTYGYDDEAELTDVSTE